MSVCSWRWYREEGVTWCREEGVSVSRMSIQSIQSGQSTTMDDIERHTFIKDFV